MSLIHWLYKKESNPITKSKRAGERKIRKRFIGFLNDLKNNKSLYFKKELLNKTKSG